MAHFAKVRDGFVVDVIVAEPEFFDTFVDESAGQWIQTSYNTHGGKHYTEQEDGTRVESADQSKALRKNYAGIGFVYDHERDAFYEPQPYPSWTLDEDTCIWNPPTPYPTDGQFYTWDEDTTSWNLVTE